MSREIINEEIEQVRVTRFSIGRVFNPGNYEHVRYEVEIQIPQGNNAALVINDPACIVEDLNPKNPVSKSDVQHARSILETPYSKVPQWEKENLEPYRATILRHDAYERNKKLALQFIDQLGGNVRYVDAKDKWEEPE